MSQQHSPMPPPQPPRGFHVVLLTGFAGSGKTTLAYLLAAAAGNRGRVYALVAPVINLMLHVDSKRFSSSALIELEKRSPETGVRETLKDMCVHVREIFGDNVLIWSVIDKIWDQFRDEAAIASSGHTVAVVSDVRELKQVSMFLDTLNIPDSRCHVHVVDVVRNGVEACDDYERTNIGAIRQACGDSGILKTFVNDKPLTSTVAKTFLNHLLSSAPRLTPVEESD